MKTIYLISKKGSGFQVQISMNDLKELKATLESGDSIVEVE